VATQGERRSQAIRAIRALRKLMRKSDSSGEKLERELDRLIKRKTLISPDSLATTGRLLQEYARNLEFLTSGYADAASIIQRIPV